MNLLDEILAHKRAEIEERRGSRVSITIRSRVKVVHKPHPKPTMNRATIREIRNLLSEVGIEPE